MSTVANWLSVVAAICNVFLLLSYAVLPVDKTHRHYLSISIASAVLIMNVRSRPPLPFLSGGREEEKKRKRKPPR